MTIYNGLNRDNIGITLVKIKPYSCFKLFFIFLLLCHLLGTPPLTNASQEEQDTQRVLIVNSYHPGYTWSDDIMLGIRDVLGKQKNVELIIEYLDTKKHFEKSYFQQIKELFRQKYKSADIDLVITSDDNALDFILSIRKELFPDIPLIFCGIDHIEPERIANQETVYGIEEADSTSSTIDLILSIHPDIESIIFIADETSTGKLMLQKVRQIESTHQNKIHFQYIIGMSVEELQSTLKDIPDNTVIFYLSFIRDKNGKVFSIKDSMQLIADSANVPVYCSWGFQPETGVLGGNVLSGYKQGEISAKVGRRLLDGNSVEEIPVKQQAPLVYKFDYHAMNRFNIDEGILPQNSVIYNRPSSLYSEHKKLIWTTLFIILCLLAFIILLFLNIERRKKAETELRKAHGNLDQKVKIRTDELTKSNELLMEEIEDRKQAEDALEDSEALLAQTGRMAKVGGWILDARTLEVTWTEETYRIHEVPLGHKPPLEEAINYFHSDDRPKLETAVKKALEHGDPYDMEVRFITANGKPLWVHTIGKPVIVEGKTVKLTGTFQDITDRKQVEEALRKSEAQKAAILDGISTNLAFVNKDLEILWANRISAESVNRNVDEIIGHKCYELWADPDAPCDDCPTAKAFQTKKTEQTIIHSPDGRVWEEKGEPVFDEKGGLIGVIEIAHDITAKARAEDALRESEERYRLLVENQTDMIVKFDVDGHLTFASQSYCKAFDKSEDELLGKRFIPLIHDEDREAVVKALDKVHRPPYIAHVEERAMTKDGWRWQAWLNTAVLNEKNEVEATVAVGRDINKQKQLEEERIKLEAQLQQAQKMEAISTLAGGVAHEFNNTLMGIMGNIELLKMNFSEDGGIDKQLESMESAGHRMSRLTAQLLAYAEGGKYQPKNLQLDDFVIETLPILQHNLSPTVRVEKVFPKDISHIKADNAQMQMVLSAILANSNEAIEDVGIIRITAENKDLDENFTKQHPGIKPGLYVSLTIEDDGKGMDEETSNRIFEPFFTTKFQGRGMGMAAAYGIVMNHDGWISVDSELGRGTKVRIYLPATEVEVEKPKEAKPEVATGSGTILMIEDEDVVIEVTQAMLEMLGYRVMAAKTGKDAIHIAETFDGQIDLALLDIKLPDINGRNLYPLIMKARSNLKVIVCSGYSIDGPAREILDEGAQDFIQKPFSIATLSEKLKEVLEGK